MLYAWKYTALTTHKVPSLSVVTSPTQAFVSGTSDYNDATGRAAIAIVFQDEPDFSQIPYLSDVQFVSKTPCP